MCLRGERCVDPRAGASDISTMKREHDTIHVRLEPTLIAELRRRAGEQERTLSVFVRRTLRDAVQRQAAEQPSERAA